MMTPSQPLPVQPANRWLNFTRTYTDSLLFSVGFCALVVLLFLAGSDEFLHWFIVPVWACGVIVCIDAYDWIRGRLSLLDPVGVIGALGFHFFFLAPLLHVHWNYWLDAPSLPLDWRMNLGRMAVFNLLGLLAYRYSRDFFLTRDQPPSPNFWQLDRSRFAFFGTMLLFVSAVLQMWVYSQFGGISGYIQAATDLANPTRMQGLGIVFLVSETFPVVALMLFAANARQNQTWRTWIVLGIVLVAFLILRVFFGGLRGSRSTILFALFWAAGALHLYVRLIPRQIIAIGIAFMIVFMYGYGFFKGYSYYQNSGSSAFSSIGSSSGRAQLEKESGRDMPGLLLGDLGRSDVQAFILDRIWSPDNTYLNDYQYSWGRTYFGAVSLLIPRSVWPGRPNPKIQEGTEIFYGRGTYKEGDTWSSKIYGLAGETMLNFGPLPIPIAFALFGLLVGKVRAFLFSLKEGDSRLLVFPFLVLMCIIALTADSDNVLFFVMQNVGIPGLLVFASSTRMKEQLVVTRLNPTPSPRTT